jgi:hypothetical protein
MLLWFVSVHQGSGKSQQSTSGTMMGKCLFENCSSIGAQILNNFLIPRCLHETDVVYYSGRSIVEREEMALFKNWR